MNAVNIRVYYDGKCKKCQFFGEFDDKGGTYCRCDKSYTWCLTDRNDATFLFRWLPTVLKYCTFQPKESK